MDSVLRGIAMYAFVWLILRMTGRRTFAQMTAFDFVLLLIVGEATQQSLLGEDFSITNGVLVVLTLVGIDVGLSKISSRWKAFDRWLDGMPIVIVKNGQVLEERLIKERVTLDEILHAARERQGLENMSEVKHAVLDQSGGISIVPREESKE
jgi:uncharacterized membrane protein YcaP (DUF421 family)